MAEQSCPVGDTHTKAPAHSTHVHLPSETCVNTRCKSLTVVVGAVGPSFVTEGLISELLVPAAWEAGPRILCQ